jgi:hypothetical protein
MNENSMRVKINKSKPFIKSGEYEHKYGGIPTFGLNIPDCPVCNHPYNLIFQFDLRDPKLSFLNLPSQSPFLFLTCLRCDLAYNEPLYYKIDNNEIKIIQGKGTEFFEDWKESTPERNIQIMPLSDKEKPESYDNREAFEEYLDENEIVKHQLGGKPYWVQSEDLINCSNCGNKMRIIGQADSETWQKEGTDRLHGHMFGDMGILTAFHCDDCNIYATFSQHY